MILYVLLFSLLSLLSPLSIVSVQASQGPATTSRVSSSLPRLSHLHPPSLKHVLPISAKMSPTQTPFSIASLQIIVLPPNAPSPLTLPYGTVQHLTCHECFLCLFRQRISSIKVLLSLLFPTVASMPTNVSGMYQHLVNMC